MTPTERQEVEKSKWSKETMQIINDLTPNIKEKAFDPDWFLLRQRLEKIEDQLTQERAARVEAEKRLLEISDSPVGDLFATRQKLETANRCVDELEKENLSLELENGRLRDALNDLSGVVAFCAPGGDSRFNAAQDKAFKALSQPSNSSAWAVVKRMKEAIENFLSVEHMRTTSPYANAYKELTEALQQAKDKLGLK